LENISVTQFESKLSDTHKTLFHDILNKKDLSKWSKGAAYALKEDIDNKNNKIFNLSTIPAFSAQKFIAGRASFMKHSILKLLEKHKNEHFHPELLKDLVNQTYELCDYFKPDLMLKQISLRGLSVKFEKSSYLGKTIFIPKIKNHKQTQWQPWIF